MANVPQAHVCPEVRPVVSVYPVTTLRSHQGLPSLPGLGRQPLLTLARDGVSREVPCSALKGETVFRCARPSGVPRGPATSTGSLRMKAVRDRLAIQGGTGDFP